MSTWTVPPNFVSGATLTEADLDTISNDLTFLKGWADLITGGTTADTGDSIALRIFRASAGVTAFSTGVTGDSSLRFNVDADGTLTWGSGAATRDTNLYRPVGVPNRLQTDDDFRAVGAVITKYKATGTPADADLLSGSTNANGAMIVTPTRLYVRVAGVWKSAPLT